MLKDNYRNTGKRGEICSNLIIKTPEQCHLCHFGLVITDIFHSYSHTYKPHVFHIETTWNTRGMFTGFLVFQ